MPAGRVLRRLAVAAVPTLLLPACLGGADFAADEPAPVAVAGFSDDDAAPEPPPAPVADEGDTADVVRDLVAERVAEEDAAAAEAAGVRPRPDWLGTRELPRLPDDLPHLPTPPELVDRRFAPPPGGLPRPDSDEYAVTIEPLPADVIARSTWREGCPVPLDSLRYLTLQHWGFDGQTHTGELVVHRNAAEGIGEVFRRLHEIRFPIEEMRVVSMADLNALSTGDGNVSAAFVCRPMASGSRWSEHSYGLALDINPFHNPYVRGRLVIPGLAASYLDRTDHRPGMIQPGDEVVRAFASIGWKWGGNWNSAKDWMHFSASGR